MANFLSKEIYDINRSDFQFQEETYDKKKDLGIGLKRNRLILRAAYRALAEVHGLFAGMAARLQRIETKRSRRGGDPEGGRAHGRYGKALADLGLHRLAMEEYTLARNQGGDGAWLHYQMEYPSSIWGA